MSDHYVSHFPLPDINDSHDELMQDMLNNNYTGSPLGDIMDTEWMGLMSEPEEIPAMLTDPMEWGIDELKFTTDPGDSMMPMDEPIFDMDAPLCPLSPTLSAPLIDVGASSLPATPQTVELPRVPDPVPEAPKASSMGCSSVETKVHPPPSNAAVAAAVPANPQQEANTEKPEVFYPRESAESQARRKELNSVLDRVKLAGFRSVPAWMPPYLKMSPDIDCTLRGLVGSLDQIKASTMAFFNQLLQRRPVLTAFERRAVAPEPVPEHSLTRSFRDAFPKESRPLLQRFLYTGSINMYVYPSVLPRTPARWTAKELMEMNPRYISAILAQQAYVGYYANSHEEGPRNHVMDCLSSTRTVRYRPYAGIPTKDGLVVFPSAAEEFWAQVLMGLRFDPDIGFVHSRATRINPVTIKSLFPQGYPTIIATNKHDLPENLGPNATWYLGVADGKATHQRVWSTHCGDRDFGARHGCPKADLVSIPMTLNLALLAVSSNDYRNKLQDEADRTLGSMFTPYYMQLFNHRGRFSVYDTLTSNKAHLSMVVTGAAQTHCGRKRKRQHSYGPGPSYEDARKPEALKWFQ